MQQIFFFFTMLITASEAFLNGSHISTSNKEKISGFVPNARTLKYANPVFENMNFPVKIDAEPEIVLPREESTFLSLCARHKRFSNDGRVGLNNLDNGGFLRNRKFLNGRRNSLRRLRLMRRKRKLNSSFPAIKTMNGNSYSGSENSSVPSVISLFHSPVILNKFYGKAAYPKSRSELIKKKQIKYLHHLPFNSKQLLKYSKLRAKINGFKRHRRLVSKSVKKHKRDAETVNVSQGNVTKDVEEKNLDEEANDSLDDSYPQDLRKEFATQHLDHATSNWQKYLELKSQPVNPYLIPPMPDDDYYDSVLDIPPPSVCVPRMNFRIPYDRKIYEDTNFESDNNDAKFFRKTETDDIIENEKQKKKKKKEKKSESSRLDKLKHMLDDVENALKEENGNSKSKMNGKGGRGGRGSGDSEDAIRAKIEVVIPLLSQISQELGKRSTQLQRITAEKKSNTTTEVEEKGEVTQDERQRSACSLDGTWLSNAMGLEINVTTQPNMILKVTMKSFKKDGPINENWSMHGLSLAKTEGPFILAAIYPAKNKIASFIGQCWICEEQEYVYGSWTTFMEKENITDLLTAVETKIDVLTRKKDKDEVT